MLHVEEVLLSPAEVQSIFGKQDENLSAMERILHVEFLGRGNQIKIRGRQEDVRKAVSAIEGMRERIGTHGSLNPADLRALLRGPGHPGEISSDRIEIQSKKACIYPRTSGQKQYVEAIRKHDLVLGIGPAGTGKTYLAVACAIEALRQGRYQRMVLARPAIEAGERLGFLPGDLEEKIKPYLQPIYDALFDMMRYEELRRWTERRIIEIIPLAYMRGRTLASSFVILDEAQNTTFEQMKMFLTRLGPGSRAVVTGDITQIDVPLSTETSGLVETQRILKGIRGVRFVYLTRKDVVRHELVKKIINAYERHRRRAAPGVHRPQPPA